MSKKIIFQYVTLVMMLFPMFLLTACKEEVEPLIIEIEKEVIKIVEIEGKGEEEGEGNVNCECGDVIELSFLELSLKTISFGGQGGFITLKVNHNIDFTVESSEPWIEIEDGAEEAEFIITVLRNDFASEREGVLVFHATDDETEAELTIKQAAGKTLASFVFKAEHNSVLDEDLVMTIEEHKIVGRFPYYADITGLIASFEGNFSAVKVNQTEQESGVTANDFSQSLNYSFINAFGEPVTYPVELFHFTGLPVISITTNSGEEVTSKDFYLDARIVIDGMGQFPDLDEAVQIKGRGNSTWVRPKKPYRLKFDKKKPVLGFPSHKSWVLLANYLDDTSLRNEVSFNMSRSSSLEWTPRSQFVELFMNGRYDGTYQLTEMIKIAADRVNVTDNGFIIEVDYITRIAPEDIYFTTPRLAFVIKEPDVVTGNTHYTFIENYINTIENILYDDDIFLDETLGYKQYIDMESFADWYLVNEITKNNDAVFFSSCYMNYAPGGKLKMGPVWDFDLALGGLSDNGREPEGFYVKNSAWISRLFEDPEFVELVKERYSSMRAQIPSIINKINSDKDYLHWSMIENNTRWKELYTPTSPPEPVWTFYKGRVDFMKNWLNQRLTWLDRAIAEL